MYVPTISPCHICRVDERASINRQLYCLVTASAETKGVSQHRYTPENLRAMGGDATSMEKRNHQGTYERQLALVTWVLVEDSLLKNECRHLDRHRLRIDLQDARGSEALANRASPVTGSLRKCSMMHTRSPCLHWFNLLEERRSWKIVPPMSMWKVQNAQDHKGGLDLVAIRSCETSPFTLGSCRYFPYFDLASMAI